MTGPELDAALARIGWGRLTLAKRLGMSFGFVRKICDGTTRMHPAVETYVTKLVRAHESVPVPMIRPRTKATAASGQAAGRVPKKK